MRLAWTLSISPDIINKIVRPELITLFVGIIEILRRALWNFLRVEKEHLVNVGSFQAVPKIHLPYENINFQDSTQDVFLSSLQISPSPLRTYLIMILRK